ncbi:MAG: hypothetical protein PUB51_00545 [Oscillospiraceae bacterium]|nr:hypothetical protein [Oscillospiraceae bacterium]
MSRVTESVIVALLGLIGALAGTYFANRKASALIGYRLEKLEEKVDKHNHVVERTYEIERRLDVDDERFKVMLHRISDLEQEGRG